MSKSGERSNDLRISSRPHKLSRDTKVEMIALLGLDFDADDEERAEEAIKRVEQLLGIYKPAQAALSQMPRPAEFVSAMTKLKSRVSRLQESLSSMEGCFRGALEVGGVDLSIFEHELSKLLETADSVKRSNEPSQGRPRNELFNVVVGRLRMIFRHYYRGSIKSRRTEGAISNLAQQEQDEVEFIIFALDDAKIDRPNKIRRIYDKAGTPLANRDKVIEGIVAKSERQKTKSSPPDDETHK